MMGLTIGIGIGAKSLRAVGVAGNRVLWAVEVDRVSDEPLGIGLTTLLRRCSVPRWPRPKVVAAIGPATSQVKRLVGLPPLRDARDLTAAVRESTRRFFLQNGVGLITTELELLAPGEAWAAALEAPAVDALIKACRAARLPLSAVVPAAVALPHALVNPEIDWRDGPVRAIITVCGQRLECVRRTVANESQERRVLQPVQGLAALGDRAPDFADAYGAACLPRETPLLLRPSLTDRTRSTSYNRLLAASIAATMGLLLAFVGPSVTAWVNGRRSDARLAILAPAEHRVDSIERRLAQASSVLHTMEAFDANRTSPSHLLRDLTKALPEHTALVALTIDTLSGTLVALSRDPTSVVDALERVPELASPELLGPVTPETDNSQSLQRLTVQFRILPISIESSQRAKRKSYP